MVQRAGEGQYTVDLKSASTYFVVIQMTIRSVVVFIAANVFQERFTYATPIKESVELISKAYQRT